MGKREKCIYICTYTYVVFVCVCVCERERERVCVFVYGAPGSSCAPASLLAI